MKTTTTVTTSSFYGNVESKSKQQSSLSHFISPQEMLRRLIPYANVQKQKEAIKPIIIKQQTEITNAQNAQLISQLQSLQTELNNIHAQVIESENLMNVRDSLYGQLDMLREQRQLIQGDVSYLQAYNSSKQVIVSIKPGQGYKEMNERLRRRMNQIRQYIHKMERENRRIQENISYTSMWNIQRNYRTQQQMTNAWVDNSYYAHVQREKSMGRVDELITRLHAKQEEALQKVRRQQEDINKRNSFNRASYVPNSTFIGSQFQTRTYYPPSETVGRRRFFSPEYRY